ncbi:MAG: ATP-binding cassette domain-containing protein, partial [Candidatus Omnitrophica bacterium]|nr:ATP-binding cassette domain-containing protein [Candidatus Omnitrophota bacterium]
MFLNEKIFSKEAKINTDTTPTATAANVRIRVRHLNAYFGQMQVLHDINLDIMSQRVTAIIGPSGCGKTTFIRCLNRMHEVAASARVEGSVLLDEEEMYRKSADLIELRRKVGMVFQRPNPFPTLSVYDNVASGLKLAGIRNKQFLDEVVEKSLQKAALWKEVEHKLHHSGMSLSGGQQQ